MDRDALYWPSNKQQAWRCILRARQRQIRVKAPIQVIRLLWEVERAILKDCRVNTEVIYDGTTYLQQAG